ncbi:aldehyde dehydrogenase family protein, partial [Sutterella wadsworthensis]
NSIFLNSGQTCTALSRLIVPKARLAEVEKLLLDHLKDYPVGDPFDPKVLIGPMASRQQFETVKSYIELGVKEGARLLAGNIPEEPGAHEKGWFIHPTIFTNVKNDMRIAREEIFGPVLCVIAYDTVDEAVAIANDTPYGLNAMVVGPKAEAQAVARRINAGNVYINDAPRDVTAPFGGYGASGIGREGGRYGLMEFTQLKAVFDHSTY